MKQARITFLHDGTELNGSVWSDAPGKPGSRWVVEDTSRELFLVAPRTRVSGKVTHESDGRTYRGDGTTKDRP